MAKLDFVDTHVHFYDMQHPELFYGHWQPGVPHPTLGWQIAEASGEELPRRRLHRRDAERERDQSRSRSGGDRQQRPRQGD